MTLEVKHAAMLPLCMIMWLPLLLKVAVPNYSVLLWCLTRLCVLSAVTVPVIRFEAASECLSN